MLLRVVDFETTGMEADDAVVQIGQCDVRLIDDAWEIGPASSMFVNPGKPICVEARAVHHIRDKDIAGAPSVDVGFLRLMDGPPDVFVAHNMKFDRQFFAGGDRKWICTLKVARRIWPDSPRHGNQVLRYHLGIDQMEGFEPWMAMPPHRAGPDTYVTAWLLCQALKHASVEEMIEWSGQPSLLPGNIQFGKHQGTPWSKIDPGYLRWMLGQDFDEDTAFTANYWLTRRTADDR